jgi:hypothetical protein
MNASIKTGCRHLFLVPLFGETPLILYPLSIVTLGAKGRNVSPGTRYGTLIRQKWIKISTILVVRF